MFKSRRLLVLLTAAVVLLSACYSYPPDVRWVDTPIGKAVAVGGVVRTPKVLSRVNPTATNTAGVVEARLVISENGIVRNVEILSATDGAAAESAKAALSQWTFAPTYVDGAPVKVVHELKITFK
jgi:hypothetical protein